jgi:hypothetical protein
MLGGLLLIAMGCALLAIARVSGGLGEVEGGP